jgi:hypothetical protein
MDTILSNHANMDLVNIGNFFMEKKGWVSDGKHQRQA